MDQAAVEAEHDRGYAGRFGPGLPRISDGQLLFLQHLLSRMKEPNEGGSRVAIVMNGSPLFTGDAGSGESEIRRWILENDWLEAIVALPEQLFYNTGIPTYVWVLTNRKPNGRKNKVQLIDATAVWTPMRKSLGDKRREITPEQIGDDHPPVRGVPGRPPVPHLPCQRLRLSQNHRGAALAAQLPGDSRTGRPHPPREGGGEPRRRQEEGEGRRAGGRGGPPAARGDPDGRGRPRPQRGLEEPQRLRGRAGKSARRRRRARRPRR